MGRFHSTFGKIGHGADFSPESWEAFFNATYAQEWGEDQGGSIQFHDADGTMHYLVLAYRADQKISLSYGSYSRTGLSKNVSFVSAPTGTLGSEFYLTDSGETVVADSFVSLAQAGRVVKEFLANPMHKPCSVSWVDAATLDWPEDY